LPVGNIDRRDTAVLVHGSSEAVAAESGLRRKDEEAFHDVSAGVSNGRRCIHHNRRTGATRHRHCAGEKTRLLQRAAVPTS
jgi:hypothetical protein